MLSQKNIIKDNPRALYISYDGIFDPVGESQVIPYLRGLAKNGVSISLISFEKKRRINKVSLHSYRETLTKEGIRWEALTYHKRPIIPATLFDVLRGIFKGWFLIKTGGIKIIHARGYIPGIIAYFLEMLTRAKFIFDMRGFWPEEKVDAGAWPKKGFLYRIVKYIENKIISGADEIIVLSEAAKNVLSSRHNPHNISVIPCCVDLQRFSAGMNIGQDYLLPKNRLLVAYLGSTGSFYNFEEAAKFFYIFKKMASDAYFVVLPNGNKEFIWKILSSFNIKQGDCFVSSVSYEHIPFYLRQCAFSLIFYRRTLSAPGCCPIKFAESLASGVPVIIGPKIGDCDTIVEREKIGIVLKEYSPECYAQAACEMSSLLLKRYEVAQRCYGAAKKYFLLEDGIERYLNVYHSLMG